MASGSDGSKRPGKKGVGRPKSDIRITHFHEVFENNETKWGCNYCQMKYGKKTSSANLKRHMQNNHPDILNEKQQEPQQEGHRPDFVNMGYTGSPLLSASYNSQGSVESNQGSHYSIPTPMSNSSLSSQQRTDFSPSISDSSNTAGSVTETFSSIVQTANLTPMLTASKTEMGQLHEGYLVPQLQSQYQNPLQQVYNFLQESHPVAPINIAGLDSDAGAPMGSVPNQDSYHIGMSTDASLDPINITIDGHVAAASSSIETEFMYPWMTEFLSFPSFAPDHGPEASVHVSQTSDASRMDVPIYAGTTNQPFSNQCKRIEGPQNPFGEEQPNSISSKNEEDLSEVAKNAAQNQMVPYGSVNVDGPRGAKRKGFDEDWSLDDLIEMCKGANMSDTEIQDKIITLSMFNPVYLNAFVNKTLHLFCNLAHSRFPKLRLGLDAINSELIGRKMDNLRAITKEQCDSTWAPLLFDVFVFTLELDDKTYVLIEIVFPGKNGSRRSCLLDYKAVPENYPMESLAEFIAEKLGEFEVDQMLSNVSVWSRKFDGLQEMLQRRLGCDKVRQRDQAFKEGMKKSNYFKLLKKSYEDQTDRIQLEGMLSLSLLEETKEQLLRYLLQPQPAMASDTMSRRHTEQHLCKQFHILDVKIRKMKNVGATALSKIHKIIGDTRKNAIYYTHKNTSPINLLHTIPIQEYVAALEDVHRHVETVAVMLQDPAALPPFDMSDLRDELELIEIDRTEEGTSAPNELKDVPDMFKRWEKFLTECCKLTDKYLGLCDYLNTNSKRMKESSACSRYAEDFQALASVQLPDEKWKKVALLRAWGRFESDYGK